MNQMTPRLIAVAVTDLKPVDMEVVRTMRICPSCGAEDKSGEHYHLMCYRCNAALPPGVRKSVDGQTAHVLLEQFLLELRALARTHVLLTRRGEEKPLAEAAEAEPVPAGRTPGQPRVAIEQYIDIPRSVTATRTPAQRRERPAAEVVWQTIWREEG